MFILFISLKKNGFESDTKYIFLIELEQSLKIYILGVKGHLLFIAIELIYLTGFCIFPWSMLQFGRYSLCYL